MTEKGDGVLLRHLLTEAKKMALVKVKRSFHISATDSCVIGEVLEVNEKDAINWIRNGWAVPAEVQTKEPAAPKAAGKKPARKTAKKK